MSQHNLDNVLVKPTFVTVFLPIAVPKPYTYYIPHEWVDQVQIGIRVEVQFGRSKRYAAVVAEVHQNPPEAYQPKQVLSIIDTEPVVYPQQIKFWQWMASYYSCTPGEVMNAALPGGLKLSSETRIVISPVFDENYAGLNDKEYMIAEAIHIQKELSIGDVQQILNQKTVYPIIQRLLDLKLIYLKEELQKKYKPKKIVCVRLQEPYQSEPDLLQEGFDKLSRSTRQVEALMAYIQMARQKKYVSRSELCKAAGVDTTVIAAMVKKGVLETFEQTISRLEMYEEETESLRELSEQQQRALIEIRTTFQFKNTVLLHGVTGSGKTRVYIELIKEALERGEQVLYLLPEIALTAQIVSRLKRFFGDDILVYHSRLNNHERVEMWRAVLRGHSIVLGARSSLFMPFKKLGLIIVDESHDMSYKQIDPAPRYHARDAAVYLSHLLKARVLLGTATPSVETYYNALQKKYGLVNMPERFGGIQLPEIRLIDARKEMSQGNMQAHFTKSLLDQVKTILSNKEQAILFQNRRGFSPVLSCDTCGNWHANCINCDVSLTYHKFTQDLRCHYCGYKTEVPPSCPACGSPQIGLKGFGTEKIEDELKVFLPDAKISRLDYDTAKGKSGHLKIINDFEEHRVDVLVGTQMVSKGLDFDNVGLVGVLSADQILQFPDFRSSERAFQLITQVSGRAGRKTKRGLVLIQAFNLTHPVLKEVLANDYQAFFQREIQERKAFKYPPFCRLIQLTLKHSKRPILNEGANFLAALLRQKFGARVMGPAVPGVSRVRNQYINNFLIKLEKDNDTLRRTKIILQNAILSLHKQRGFSTIRVNIDVDPN